MAYKSKFRGSEIDLYLEQAKASTDAIAANAASITANKEEIDAKLAELEQEVDGIKDNNLLKECEEEGLYISDSQGNAIAMFNQEGFKSYNIPIAQKYSNQIFEINI